MKMRQRASAGFVKGLLMGGVLSSVLPIVGLAPVLAGPKDLPPLPPPAEATVDNAYDIGAGSTANSIAVGKRGGKGKREFNVTKNRSGDQVEVDFDETGSKADRRGRKFSYTEGKSVTITLGGQQLLINFQPDGRVQVGNAAQCAGNDDKCIAQAVRASLPNLTKEEAAATLVSLRDDLGKMKHGKSIERVLNALAL